MSVTKQGQSGIFTPQWHPRYSVALLPSVSPWLLQSISLANITLTQKFLIALTELPLLIFFFFFFQSCTACQHRTQAGQCFGHCVCICKWHLRSSEIWDWGQVGVQIDLQVDCILDLTLPPCGLLSWDNRTKQNCFRSPHFVSFPPTLTFAFFKGGFVLSPWRCVCTMS